MYRLTTAFPYLLNRVGVRMGELFSRRLERHHLTLPMYRVMALLWERGDQRLGELSKLTSVEMSTLSRLVGVLQQKGLLSRTRPHTNGRTVRINLSAKGRSLVEELIPLAELHEEVGLRGFSADEIAKFKQDLIAVYRNLDELELELPSNSGARAPSASRQRASAKKSRSRKQRAKAA